MKTEHKLSLIFSIAFIFTLAITFLLPFKGKHFYELPYFKGLLSIMGVAVFIVAKKTFSLILERPAGTDE